MTSVIITYEDWRESHRCQIEGCKGSTFQASYRWCKVHDQRNRVYGSPTPVRQCFGCKSEFTWYGEKFRNKAYCLKCIELLNTYQEFVPNKAGFLNAIAMHHLTVIDYLNMLIRQNFRCAVCKEVETVGITKSNGRKRLCLDHNHLCCPGAYSCGKCVRGLVCDFCNLMIGRYENNNELIVSMMTHLEGGDAK